MPSKLLVMVLVFSAAASARLVAQGDAPADRLALTSGGSIAVDGVVSAGEWSDAASVEMPLAGDRIVTIRFKHDGQALLFAFEGLTAEPFLVPEALLDLDNDKSADWRQDDWWFHASFTDCSSRGRFNDWSSCVPEAATWLANNLAEGTGDGTVFPAAFEISIPFATLDWIPAPGAVIGLAFNLTDTASDSRLWPAGARLEDPSSWGEAVVADGR